MQPKIVTYKRILNLGNYESQHLEESIELSEGDDVDMETSRLMEFVERKIREYSARKIQQEIKQLKTELIDLQNEYHAVKTALKDLKTTEPNVDDIPFDSGELSKDSTSSPQLTDGF